MGPMTLWSVLELKLEMEVGGWWTGLLGTAIARAEQPIVMKGEECSKRLGCFICSVGGFEVMP